MLVTNNHQWLYFMVIVYSISFITTLIILIMFCVCNPKTKRRFSKHKSFILTHDLSSNGSTNCGVGGELSNIDANNDQQLKVKLRALPDIPQQQQQQQPVPGTAVDVSIDTDLNDVNDHGIIIEDSVYTSPDKPVSTTTIATTVSTTTTVVIVRHHQDHHHPHQYHHEDNVDNHAYARIRNLITNNNSSNDSSTENDTDDYSDPTTVITASNFTHNLPPPPPPPPPSDDSRGVMVVVVDGTNDSGTGAAGTSNHVNDSKKEISYNTISVREPLAKVLAERTTENNNVEHHYNEVEEEEEEERISSFYEEINSGSVTYSKIDEPSTSAYQPPDSSTNDQPTLPLYSFVQKRPKKNREQIGGETQTGEPVMSNNEPDGSPENLYTKVMKPKKSRDSTVPSLQRYSSKPPPLPPLHPLEPSVKIQPHHRNTIHVFGHSSLSSSSFMNTDNEQIEEKDPGYETVSNHHQNEQFDYGYEAILNDPAYEVVVTPVNVTDNCPDNGYETIKNHYVSESSEEIKPNHHHHVDEDDEDEQSDPNYEIIANIKTDSSNNVPVPPPALPPNQNHHQSRHHHESNSNTTTMIKVNSDDNIVIIEHL